MRPYSWTELLEATLYSYESGDYPEWFTAKYPEFNEPDGGLLMALHALAAREREIDDGPQW